MTYRPLPLSVAAPLLALLVASCAATPREPTLPGPDDVAVRVATYNVNYGLAGDDATLEAVAALDADVVCLQETTPAWEERLRAALEGDYPEMAFVHSGGAGGAAVLSRHPILESERLDVEAPGWFPAWRVVVDAPGGPLQMIVVHLRPPVSDSGSVVSGYLSAGDTHLGEIADHWKAVDPDMPTVVLGDFNESDDGEAIAWLERRGMINALPLFQPDAPTWRWQTSIGEVTTNLDHVMVDPDLEVLNAEVKPIGRSDHLPIVVDLRRQDEDEDEHEGSEHR